MVEAKQNVFLDIYVVGPILKKVMRGWFGNSVMNIAVVEVVVSIIRR